MRDLLHDLILIASWPALAAWARWYFPQVASLIADRSEPLAERTPAWLSKTVSEVGWNRNPGGIIFYKPLSEA